MDVIWKHLSDNHHSCQRLLLYSQSDPGTGATFAVRCNALVGVTSEENFLNDALYLIEGVLPLNETLRAVEIEWSFLSHLAEDDRDNFIRGVASLKKLEEFSIRGIMSEDSRLRFRSLLQIPECARGLKHLAIELDEVHVEDPAEMGLAALLFLRCQHLESFHVRGLMPAPDKGGVDFDCSILLSALGKIPTVHTIHISRNQDNPKTVNLSALRDLCALPNLQSLSLMNMGLTDKHCKIFKRFLFSSSQLHSLILVDNPSITEKGNKNLLRLLEKNRSIYNSTFGTDSETVHRTAQLVHLHLNRCGRAKVQAPTSLDHWLNYLARINETVPEELELDSLFISVQENPEIIVQHCIERDFAWEQRECTPQVAFPLTPTMSMNEASAYEGPSLSEVSVTAKKLPTRKDTMVLNDWESIFPLLNSHTSVDSMVVPAHPECNSREQFDCAREGQLDSHSGETFPSNVVEEPIQDYGERSVAEESDDRLFLSFEHSSGYSVTSEPSRPSTEDSNANLEQISSSWDSVVGSLAELERTTHIMIERFRDESCWVAYVATPT